MQQLHSVFCYGQLNFNTSYSNNYCIMYNGVVVSYFYRLCDPFHASVYKFVSVQC